MGRYSKRGGRRLRIAALTVAVGAVAAGQFGDRVLGAGAVPVSAQANIDAIARLEGARDAWACGWDGRGVDVALVDTGVTPVPGTGTVVNGPDLSFDAQTGGVPHLDMYGHGTHLASIINGRDPGVSISGGCRLRKTKFLPTKPTPVATGYAGVAPGARVVNVKVGAADGSVDPTQIVAAIDWVVQHRATDGLNIRVLALAYGAPSRNDAEHDALSHAVEVARRNGIVVVASAGNDGTTLTDLAFPARNPNVIAVGSAQSNGSPSHTMWSVADFSDRGTLERGVDLLALGQGVEGLRVPGSVVDELSGITDGRRFVRGTGTSQAAAVTAGLAAVLVQRYPQASSDQIKGMLKRSSTLIAFKTNPWAQGAGAIVTERFIVSKPAPEVPPVLPATFGDAPIGNDRVDDTVLLDGIPLVGEIDVQGNPWPAAKWADAATNLTSWQAGQWMGHQYAGDKMTSTGWSVAAWPTSWSGVPLAGTAETAGTWDGVRWNGLRWNGLRWSGVRWNGVDWDGVRWNGVRWNGSDWS